jgi:hypothetical protein
MIDQTPQIRHTDQTLERYLTRLLLALVSQSGGELRVTDRAMSQTNDGGFLIRTWDNDRREIVLRAGERDGSEVYVIDPPANVARWEARAPLAENPNGKRSSSTLDDERLAGMVNQRNREAYLRKVASDRYFVSPLTEQYGGGEKEH